MDRRLRSEGQRGKAALIIVLVVVGLCVVGSGVSGLLFFLHWDRVPPGFKMDDHPPGTKLTFPKFNFSFAVPYKPWTRIRPDRINRLASVAYMQGKEQVFFMIIAEAIDPDIELTDELLTTVVKNNLRQASKSSRFIDQRPEQLHAMEGTAFEAEAHVSGFHAHYRYWVGTVNGYVYQLICWGQQKDRGKVNAKAEEMFQHFAILDYTKSAGDP